MKKEFKITGMRCNNCRANVERAIKAVEGVENAVVTLEPGKAEVEGNFSEDAVIEAVEDLGFVAE
ncbi:MAG: heavy metal-associated domain-containing protein [Bacteroidales bacterium]|nr:heavy-metal-associated domain-containing protein [Muribaculaceae bacterium]MDO4972006.1 heavy metal-associated domain-containing protein [Bacteroidales bacterium]